MTYMPLVGTFFKRDLNGVHIKVEYDAKNAYTNASSEITREQLSDAKTLCYDLMKQIDCFLDTYLVLKNNGISL